MVKKTADKTTLEKIWKKTRFSKENQPSAEAKKTWRDRKKEAMKMLNDILEKEKMTYKDFLIKYMDRHTKWKGAKEVVRYTPKDTLQIRERYMVLYVYDRIGKWSLDWFDRHISYAPQKTELAWNEWKSLFNKITVTIDDHRKWW